MNAADLRLHRTKILDANREYLHNFLATDPFAKWRTTTMPETMAERSLFHGIQILLVESDNADGFAYLRRCSTIVEKADRDDIYRSGNCSRMYPLNRATAGAVLAGFRAGADDYVTKPYHVGVLEARIAIGARGTKRPREVFGCGLAPHSTTE